MGVSTGVTREDRGEVAILWIVGRLTRTETDEIRRLCDQLLAAHTRKVVLHFSSDVRSRVPPVSLFYAMTQITKVGGLVAACSEIPRGEREPISPELAEPIQWLWFESVDAAVACLDDAVISQPFTYDDRSRRRRPRLS